MQKLKRILALTGVVILVGMYLVVLVLGLTASPATSGALMAAIGCTVVIPCLLYGFLLVTRLLTGNRQEPDTDAGSSASDQNKRRS